MLNKSSNLLLLFVFIIFIILPRDISAQSVGDYKFDSLILIGDWSDISNWKIFDGSDWVDPTLTDGYPGENYTPSNVTIQSITSINLDVTPANPIGNLTLRNLDFFLTVGDPDLIISGNLITEGIFDYLLLAGSGNFIIEGNLYINDLGKLTRSGSGNLTVLGTTTINATGSFTDNSDNGITTFAGQVINNGTWLTSAISTTTNLVFQGGIDNSGTFIANSATFNTNDNQIDGSSALSFSGTIDIDGITLTNNNTINMTNTGTGTLMGTGNFIQGSNSTLNFAGQSSTVNSISATASNNTVNFNQTGDQPVFTPASNTFYNLTVSSGLTKTLPSDIICLGDVVIEALSTLDVSANNYSISVAGNWTNESLNTPAFNSRNGTVTFNGSSQQTITNTGDASGAQFYNLITNNSTAGYSDIILNNDVEIDNTLTLTDGTIVTSPGSLTLNDGATITLNGSPQDNSYIEGALNKIVFTESLTNLLLPIGKDGIYRPLELAVDQPFSLLPTTYTAEMFNTSAISLGYTVPSGIEYVSAVRYYTINQSPTLNLDDGSLTLYYGPDDEAFDPANLTLVKDDGAGNWINLNGTASGTPTGSITSSSFTSFSSFALANLNGGNNPLPVELSSFNAINFDNSVKLNWTTASETNNDYFTLEKSKDGFEFIEVAKINGAGNSKEALNYSFIDKNPYQGLSYYRLKQTDFDGTFTYSKLISSEFKRGLNKGLKIVPNPSSGNFSVQLPDLIGSNSTTISIMNQTGRIIQNYSLDKSQLSDPYLTFQNFPKGIYLIRLNSDQLSVMEKVVVK